MCITIKQIGAKNELQEEIDESTTTVRDFNICLSETNSSSRHKVSNSIVEFNNQLHITDMYRIPDPITAEYTFFSNSFGTFTKTDYILGHNFSFNCKTMNHIMPALKTQGNYN